MHETTTASTMVKSDPVFQPNRILSFLRVAEDHKVEQSEDDSDKASKHPKDTSFIGSDESEPSFNQNVFKNLQNPSSVTDTIPSDQTLFIGNDVDPAKLKENDKIKTLF